MPRECSSSNDHYHNDHDYPSYYSYSYFTPPMKVLASGAAPLNSAPEKSKPLYNRVLSRTSFFWLVGPRDITRKENGRKI
mmetsp:Transcript_14166/g.34123  ORF Transcript_14166/g.34123 Transcript_14166/m.34123 type:complete len:80 (-) Transcript_14166:34-273(-)